MSRRQPGRSASAIAWHDGHWPVPDAQTLRPAGQPVTTTSGGAEFQRAVAEIEANPHAADGVERMLRTGNSGLNRAFRRYLDEV